MPRLERSIDIRAPAESVWRALVDPELLPEWEAGVVAVEDARGPLSEPEASCIQVLSFRRRTLRGELEVTEASPPRRRVVRIQPPLTATALREERLVPTEGGTHLTMKLTYETRAGPLGTLLNVTLTRPRLAVMLAGTLRNLRRLVESEP